MGLTRAWLQLARAGMLGLVLATGYGCAPPVEVGTDGSGDDTPGGGSRAESAVRTFQFELPLFSADSAWNQRADLADVLPESDAQIQVLYRVLLGENASIRPSGYGIAQPYPFMDVTYDEFAVAIGLAGDGEKLVEVRVYEGDLDWPGGKFEVDEVGGPITIPTVAGMVRPAGPQGIESDGHLVLFDQAAGTAYDFWQATTAVDASGNSLGGGVIGSEILAVGAGDFFDIRGDGTNPDGVSSARAVGTALLAGIILPEDVHSGVIAHALGFAIPGPRNLSPDPGEPLALDYFYPASTTETDFYSVDPMAPAAGQRLRLKDSLVDDEGQPLNESELAPITQMFVQAFRDYRAYIVDNGLGFSFTAEDIYTAPFDVADDRLNELLGEPPGTPVPDGVLQWQLLMERLNSDLERIPLAYGPGGTDQDPVTAVISVSNFEFVEPAQR